MTKQPISGVAPATLDEVTVMIVWPSLAASSYGRWWGRRYQNDFGFELFGIPVTLGRIMALLSIPLILPIYFHTLIPRLPLVLFGVPNSGCRRYRLTNRRVVVEQGFAGEVQKSVTLDRFDDIEVQQVDGQAWYNAGDLIFRLGQVETFRLQGVPRPESFRQTCLKAQRSHAGVQQAREAGLAV